MCFTEHQPGGKTDFIIVLYSVATDIVAHWSDLPWSLSTSPMSEAGAVPTYVGPWRNATT